jgi:hypothetical protein
MLHGQHTHLLSLCCGGASYAVLCCAVLPGERIMKLAEELYQAGFISYPRTETDVYDPGMDLRVSAGDQLTSNYQS